MADIWNDNIPVATNTVAAEIPDMEQNFGWLRRLVRMCVGWKDSTIGTVGCLPHRARFRWKDDDEIYIDPGSYFLDGTVRQVQFWDAAITFQFGSAGSNADSSDLGASEWHYVYIDDSGMADGTSEISAAGKFLNSTTAPSWSDTKHGFYNGSDLCIFAVYSDADSHVTEFYHNGGRRVTMGESIVSNINNTDIDDTFTDCTLVAPDFGTNAEVLAAFRGNYNTAAGELLYWRKNGSSVATGHIVGYVAASCVKPINTVVVVTDDSQKIEVAMGASTASTMYVYTDGFYLPVGM